MYTVHTFRTSEITVWTEKQCLHRRNKIKIKKYYVWASVVLAEILVVLISSNIAYTKSLKNHFWGFSVQVEFLDNKGLNISWHYPFKPTVVSCIFDSL